MISINFNGNACFILDDQPNWDSQVSIEASIPASYERGLTGKETRRPMGDTLRLSLKYTAILTSLPAITNLRNSLQTLAAQQILCPLWAAPILPSGAPTVTTPYYALFNLNGSFNSVVAAEALPVPFTAYPLLVGTLKELPEPQMLAGGVVSVDYEFDDSDNYPVALPAYVAPAGLNTAGGIRPLFPLTPDWSTSPHSGAADQDVDRRQIGMTRTLATAYYQQRGRRTVKQFFTLTGFDPFNLLSFFTAQGGEQNNFWLGAALNEANLAVNALSTDTQLTVDDGAALGTNSFVLLGDGVNRVPLVVQSVAGNVWTLPGAIGTAFTAGRTRIESLVLSRFDALKLTLTFKNPQFATSQIQFKELPWETNAVAGETYGTTMGALPVTASFFLFTMTTPSTTTSWRFTSYERTLSDGVNNWISAAMEFDAINETADLKRNETTITSRNFAGNPLALLFPLALEWPLMIQIFEGDITPSTSAVTNLRCYFSGEVGGADMEPPFITAQCATLSHIFDRQIPRRLFQQTDNWALFETANTLLPVNWLWSAVVVSYSAATSTLIVGTITSTQSANAFWLANQVHYFAAGYLVTTSAATGAMQARMIADNLAPVAGQMTLQLSTLLTTAPAVGDVVSLYPGYDGQAATATNKFANYGNFGGFPFIPAGNPTVMRIVQPAGTGKK